MCSSDLDLTDDQILQKLPLDLCVMGIGTGDDRIVIIYKKLRHSADDGPPEIVPQIGNKDRYSHGASGTQDLGGAVRLVIQVGDSLFNAETVLFLDFFVVKIFGDGSQGEAGFSGNIFNRDFHVLLRSVIPDQDCMMAAKLQSGEGVIRNAKFHRL